MRLPAHGCESRVAVMLGASLTLIASRPAAQTEINLIDAMNSMAAFAPGGARLPLGPDGENLLPYHVRSLLPGPCTRASHRHWLNDAA